MDDSKRGFLKIAGGTVLGSLGAAWAKAALGQTPEVGTPAVSSQPKRLWGMVVDVRRCREKAGCDACIRACHVNHNVPSIGSPKEEVKWIWKEPYPNAFPTQAHRFTEEGLRDQQLPVLCNHCENPPCVRVCPTQATWKRPEDGVVMMDPHRCIGCRYCLAACPYGSRSFNWSDPRLHLSGETNPDYPTRTRGVVEKCTFCAERLADGKSPLCVEACRAEGAGALFFGDLQDPGSEVAELLRRHHSIRRKPALGTGPQVYYLV